MKNNLVVVLGPTAVGKTSLGVKLAYELNGEIISADSRQVYKGMDIGTGKDLEDYFYNNVNIRYHLIDIADPKVDEYNVYQFQNDFFNAFEEISSNKKLPVLVGGTGLYLSSVLQDYKFKISIQDNERIEKLNKLDFEELKRIYFSLKKNMHNKTDLTSKERLIKAILIEESIITKNYDDINLNPIILGIFPEREIIKKRIKKRLKERLENGMIEEVKQLIEQGVSHDKLEFFGLEYKFLSLYLRGELNYNDMFQKLYSSICKFAKRQMTWFRKMEREGVVIHHLDEPDLDKALKIINEYGK